MIRKEINLEMTCSASKKRRGGNRKPKSYGICLNCNSHFLLPHLKRKFCSYACKVVAQTTGRKSYHKTITKARNAQNLLRYHVQQGHITRPTTCEECKSETNRIEGAHFNYDEPLRVRWLCVSCHRKWDKREPKQATIKMNCWEQFTGKKAVRPGGN